MVTQDGTTFFLSAIFYLLFSIFYRLSPQLPPLPPQFPRLKNPNRRNNASNQFRRRHVKSRIQRPAARVRNAHISHSPRLPFPPRLTARSRTERSTGSAQHFALVTLFN